jgi:signal transduction histidine kinase
MSMDVSKRVSLITRLIKWQIMAMSFAWACLLAWIIYSMLGFGSGDLDRRMTYFATVLAETSALRSTDSVAASKGLQTVVRAFADVVVKSLDSHSSDKYIEIYQVLTSDNQLLYKSNAAPNEPILIANGLSNLDIDGVAHRVVRVQSANGAIAVVLAESIAFRQASMLPLLISISISQVFIFLVCIAVLWIIAKRSFAPVKRLAETLNQRQLGDLAPLDNNATYREIAPLVSELNALLARESGRLNLERGFLADAAHELRTPLAAMAVQAQLLIDATEPVSRKLATTRLQQGLQRVSHLLTQLLTIARIDASDAYTKGEVIDAASVLRECLVEFIPAAQYKSITVELDAPDEGKLFFSQLGFVSIANNLIDNAIRYTEVGGIVLVSLFATQEQWILTIKDDGLGIDANLRNKVFERFFRAPDVKPAGSGLGLSIVEKIANAGGVTISLDDGLNGRNGCGLSVVLIFPKNANKSIMYK